MMPPLPTPVLAWAKTIVLLGTALSLYLGAALLAIAFGAGPVEATVAANGAVFVGVVVWRAQVTEFLDGPAPSRESTTAAFWAWVAAGLVTCWLAGQLLATWLYTRFGSQGFDAVTQTRTQAPLALLLLTTLLIAPLGEEALMRGAVYPLLRRHWPPLAAAGCSAAVFSLLHGNLIQGAVSLPLGVLLALLYEHVQRLWPVIAAHIAFNTASVLVPTSWLAALTNGPVVLISCSLVALVLLGMQHDQ